MPSTVVGVTDAVELTSAFTHSCAVRATGAVVCWGEDTFGQLGAGSVGFSPTPVAAIGLSDAAHVSADMIHTCATTTLGQLYCWGSNSAGELTGTPTLTNVDTPVAYPF